MEKGFLIAGGAMTAVLAWILMRRKAGAEPEPLIYTCHLCGATFSSQEELDEHYALVHPDEPQPPPPPPECTDGEPYCVMNDLYQCIDGKVILVEQNSLQCGYVPPPPPPPEDGYIDGTVYESGVGGIEGVQVTADDMQSDMTWTAFTDSEGHYLLGGLPVPGDGSLYLKIIYNKEGYTSASITTTLNATHPHRTKNVTLTPTGGGSDEDFDMNEYCRQNPRACKPETPADWPAYCALHPRSCVNGKPVWWDELY